MTAQPKHKYTLEEYLEMDRKSEARLEYWNGEIFDMSGVSPEHDQIESNLNLRLRLKLEGRPRRVFLANTRIKVPSLPPYRYSDSSGLCGQPLYETIGGVKVLTNPALIIEVLSDSTEAYDRGDKFTHYKSMPSFCEYLLIAQHRPHVTQLVKQDDGSWKHCEYNDLAGVVKLVSLDCELSLQEIYERVTFDESATNPHLRPLE
jgi:Uma2 family endonuclease